GGVIGCSIAYHLARAGLRVTLCERGELGAQSTGRCAGGVRQQFSSETNVRLGQLSVRMLERFEDEVGTPAAFHQIGYLLLLSTEEQVASFRGQLAMWHRLGLTEARWVSPAEAQELSPAISVEGLRGGTFCPTDGIASPSDVTAGYAAAARRLGARVRTGVAVRSITVEHGRVVGVETADGPIAAPLVFNCAGAWSAEIAATAGLVLPVVPYPRHIFVGGGCPEVSRETPMTIDFTTSFYFHPEGDGVLFGMGERDEQSTFATEVDWSLLERIQPVAARRAPPLVEVGIRTAWAGLYEVTPDHQPFVGAVAEPTGLWCASGFSGHGFQQAPAVGLLVSQLVTDGRAEIDLAAFDPHRQLGDGGEPETTFI
ncbi:MAG TPA: FAD-binding oxidoreductase, partial [Candidatus Dormibacteraeota bacterium]|nr:FAD-binding oxidoreductase [Candidatus Dormibacteraeota bacterium]